MLPDLPSWPVYSKAERAAVDRVLERGLGNYWYGSEGKAFEREFASYCGVAHGLAVANGTVALELCLRALGIGSGDEVVTTPPIIHRHGQQYRIVRCQAGVCRR